MTVIAQDDHLTTGAWAACGDIDFFFLEHIFTSGIILNETARTKSVKIYYLYAKGYHVNKNNEGTLCESTIFFGFWVRVICQCR